jgi:FkbH-like protein
MTAEPAVAAAQEDPRRRGRVKCVAWDLDGTLWDGVLLEDPEVVVKDEITGLIKALDEVGIVHSVCSKNDHDLAMARLEKAGIAEYFLVPQINWGPKSASVGRIAAGLNIGIDAIAFVDDQPFELAEVQHVHPGVLCVPAGEIMQAARLPEFSPKFVTSESRERRQMYRTSQARDAAERDYSGPGEEFLATLGLRMRIAPVAEGDLQRAEELTVRTNQLNSTGVTFGYEELDAMRNSPRHLLLIASLEDRFGSYGKVGLAAIEKSDTAWKLRLLLMSCRVVSRGAGTILLGHIMRLARDEGVRLLAEFRDTGRNRMSYLAYMMAGFRQVAEHDGTALLECSLDQIQDPPPYLALETG